MGEKGGAEGRRGSRYQTFLDTSKRGGGGGGGGAYVRRFPGQRPKKSGKPLYSPLETGLEGVILIFFNKKNWEKTSPVLLIATPLYYFSSSPLSLPSLSPSAPLFFYYGFSAATFPGR